MIIKNVPDLKVKAFGKEKPLVVFLEDVLNLPEEDVKQIFDNLYEESIQEGWWD